MVNTDTPQMMTSVPVQTEEYPSRAPRAAVTGSGLHSPPSAERTDVLDSTETRSNMASIHASPVNRMIPILPRLTHRSRCTLRLVDDGLSRSPHPVLEHTPL